jgi:hypothetical protein
MDKTIPPVQPEKPLQDSKDVSPPKIIENLSFLF